MARNRRVRTVRKSNQYYLPLLGMPSGLRYETLELRQMLAPILATSPDNQWHALDPVVISQTQGTPLLKLTNYGVYDLQEQTIGRTLSQAPLEFTDGYWDRAVTISVPTPKTGFARFLVVESPMMEPGLAAQFPGIKTYRGIGIDDPTARINFDLTYQGFHAQVLGPNGSYYVDPFFRGQSDLYASYFATDLRTSDEFHEHAEDVHDEEEKFSLGERNFLLTGEYGPTAGRGGEASEQFGTELRTFRLAVAATGEYTAFHGGTVALGQAAIVTAMNRVNGVYENDLSIRMVLVANNSSLVYTNSATDPYTNTNGGTMLGQNQTNIDAVIGSANYDIGHVFSTGGGGVAGLGVVGINGSKARGVTGSGSPTGDAFWIDYVAHEMGHQYGGSHTFNGTAGSCAGGNRSAANAYEPGSGSTIQAYAGICGSNDLQSNSDAMFHIRSIDQIRAHIDNVIPLVGTRTNTGNAEPTVNAGGNFIIPANTPFELTATGSDANSGNVLTYSWEQYDLGPANSIATGWTDNGQSPLFRTWSPSTSPTRVFPRLSNLVNNTVPFGEKLPTVDWNGSSDNSAAMDFRVVVRDNSSGGGGVNNDRMFVRVVAGTAFAVTSQNTTTSWTGNTSQTITWNVAGTTASPISAANVDIYLSTDGGFTYPTLLASATPNDGSQAITVPNISTSTARIKVKATGNIFFDINNANITITPVTVTPTVNISGPAGQIPEGASGSSQAVFVLTLSAPPTASVSVNYASSSVGFSNPATAGSDYTAVNGTANFGIGQTTFNIPVTIFGDRFMEGPEDFKLTLSSPNGVVLGTSTVNAKISDDDAFALGKPIDFGTATSPVQVGASGFVDGAYKPIVGAGWSSSSTGIVPVQFTVGTDMTQDTAAFADAFFRIDIPNGTYNVTVIIGIVDFNPLPANILTSLSNFTFVVEGDSADLILSQGSYVTKTFSAVVSDGALDVGIKSRSRGRMAGLLVTPV